MKIAYFSPLPPQKSGISAYSKHLLKALSSKSDLEVFHYRNCELSDITLHDYCNKPSSLSHLNDFDVFIYHIGNNPHYHSVIRDVLVSNPGIVVLHDAFLYYLVAGRGIGGLFREFQLSEIDPTVSIFNSLSKIKQISQNDILKFGSPEIYPFLGTVLRYAKMVIVHSFTALKAVKEFGFHNKVIVIPHLAFTNDLKLKENINIEKIRSEMGIGRGEFLVGLFGFIGPTKQIQKVLFAIKELVAKKYPVKLLIVGIGDDIKPMINKLGLSDYIIVKGFVNDDDFQILFSVVDAVINLRFPSSGEASGSLIHAFSHGKASVVSDVAWFSELPNRIVKKIPIGINEVPKLVNTLKTWIDNPEVVSKMGKSALRYSQQNFSPDKVAEMYIDACRKL